MGFLSFGTWFTYILAWQHGITSTMAQRSPVKYCTYDMKPYTTCSENGESFGLFPSAPRVIEALQGGGDPGVDYQIECLDSRSDVLAALRDCTCDIGIGDFTTVSKNLIQGTNLTLSTPLYHTAYGILTTKSQSSNMWGLFKPFSAGLWILIIMTPFFVALFMTYFSWTISKYKNEKNFKWSVLPQFTFQNTMSLFNDYTDVEYIDWKGKYPYMVVLKIALQAMLVSYAFLCLIIASVYTAELTNLLFEARTQESRRTFDEIVREVDVVSAPDELDLYIKRQYNRSPVKFSPETTDAVLEQVEQVRRGAVDAMVFSVGSLLWVTKLASEDQCDIGIVHNSYRLHSNQAMVYSGCLSETFIDDRDKNIYTLLERGVLEGQEDSLIPLYTPHSPYPACAGTNDPVSIPDLAGGWVILAVAVLLPFLLTISRYLFYLGKKCVRVYGSAFIIPPTFGGTSSSDTELEKREEGRMSGDDIMEVRMSERVSNVYHASYLYSSGDFDRDTVPSEYRYGEREYGGTFHVGNIERQSISTHPTESRHETPRSSGGIRRPIILYGDSPRSHVSSQHTPRIIEQNRRYSDSVAIHPPIPSQASTPRRHSIEREQGLTRVHSEPVIETPEHSGNGDTPTDQSSSDGIIYRGGDDDGYVTM